MIKKITAFILAMCVAAVAMVSKVFADNWLTDIVYDVSINKQKSELLGENGYICDMYRGTLNINDTTLNEKGTILLIENETNDVVAKADFNIDILISSDILKVTALGIWIRNCGSSLNVENVTLAISNTADFLTTITVFNGENYSIQRIPVFYKNGVVFNVKDTSKYHFKYAVASQEKIIDIANRIDSKTLNLTDFAEKENVQVNSATSGIIMTGYQTPEEKQAGGNLKIAPSWIPEGVRPYISVKINDNGKNHSYSIRVSANTEFAGVLAQIMRSENAIVDNYNNMDVVRQAQQGQWWDIVLFALNPAIYLGSNVASATYSSALHGIYKSAYVEAIETSGSKMNNIQFNVLADCITSDNFKFKEQTPVVNSRVISIALDDYMNIQVASVLKVELIDNTNSSLLDYTYILSNRNYGISSTVYGQKVYDYSDDNACMSDITNNVVSNAIRQYTDGKASSTGSNLPYITPGEIDNIYDDMGITDFLPAIQGYVDQSKGFFSACWGLFPPELWAVIIVGFTVLIGACIVKAIF